MRRILNMDQFQEFTKQIQVMKPAHIDEDNSNHLKRMEQILIASDYAAEEKIDGCHYLCYGGRFMSTDNVEKTANYPHLWEFFAKLYLPNLILDGEINYPGKTSQFCTRVTGANPGAAKAFQSSYGLIHYTIWDILRTPKGTWLINIPYKQRREILEQFYDRFIRGTSMEKYIHLTDMRTTDKKAFFEDIIASGREGVVLKKLDSLYVMGKKPMWQWMKLKQKDTADLIITGYKEPTVEYNGKNIETWPYWKDVRNEMRPVTKDYYNGWIGALELGAYVNGELVFICTCSGLDEELKATISSNRNMFLGKVVKISYMEKTEAGYPRHPRFEMFHESKVPEECTWILET